MTVRIEFPFAARFEIQELGTNSREVRTDILQNYLLGCGIELGSPVENFQVAQFNGEDDGEFWEIKAGK